MANSLEFYNKQLQALRKKDAAEEMIRAGDYENARNQLLESLDFFPLGHILPRLAVCDILFDSSYNIPGHDIDYYRILRVAPSSTPQDIVVRYNELLTLLEPVKEVFPVAKLALDLIREAVLALLDSENSGLTSADSPGCSEKGLDLVVSAESSNSVVNLMEVVVVDGDSPINEVYQDFFNFDEGNNIVESMEAGEIWATRDHHRYVQIMSKSGSSLTVIGLKPVPVNDRGKRWREAGLPVGCGSFLRNLDSGEFLISPMELSHKCTWTPGLNRENFSIYPRKGEVWAVYDELSLENWFSNHEANTSFRYRLVEVISKNCSNHIGIECAFLEKVEGFRTIFRRQEGISIGFLHLSPSDFYLLSHKLPAIRLTGNEIESGMWEVDHLSVPDDLMTLPYGIARGQVWAISRGKDSMPRQYVVIDSIVSNTQARVTFLEPVPETELEMNWKRKNLPITCGRFDREGNMASLEASELSHFVGFEKSLSSFEIFPAKGEIWAMYGRWNSCWDASDYENCEYWIVEIGSDFSAGDKMTVTRLKEVNGCLTLFQRLQTDGFALTREISKAEMLDFSHRIRLRKVPGIASYGVAEDSYSLEPDDLPKKRSSF